MGWGKLGGAGEYVCMGEKKNTVGEGVEYVRVIFGQVEINRYEVGW